MIRRSMRTPSSLLSHASIMTTMALLSSFFLLNVIGIGMVDIRRSRRRYHATAFLASRPPASVPPTFASRHRKPRCGVRRASNDIRDVVDVWESSEETTKMNDVVAFDVAAIVNDPLGRRSSMMRIVSSTSSTLFTAFSCLPPNEANAASSSSSSDLFRPNPLTSPILERLRIWDQDEADNIAYGGELASPNRNAGDGDVYVTLMQPILDVECDLRELSSLLKSFDGNGDVVALLDDANAILTRSKFDKLVFKKSFNAFADNIYYSDPDRANLYLGGGALPKNSQSIAYLLRNEILTNVEDMRAEVAYLVREAGKNDGGGGGDVDLDELRRLCASANDGIGRYVDLVPPGELEAARAEYEKKK